jgi:hypothetical protein
VVVGKFNPIRKVNTLEVPVYGIDAISAANGWAMAIAGALIVMSGLSLLSFVISQLHKLAALLEKTSGKQSEKALARKTEKQIPSAVHPPAFNIDEAREAMAPLVSELGEDFELKLLYELAAANDLPHVHLSIRSLRESGVIAPTAEGLFRWQG